MMYLPQWYDFNFTSKPIYLFKPFESSQTLFQTGRCFSARLHLATPLKEEQQKMDGVASLLTSYWCCACTAYARLKYMMKSYRQGWDLTVDTPLVSVVATFRWSCVGVDREPSQCSLKYGRFQACVPVVVNKRRGGGGVEWPEAGGASYPWEWNAFPFVALQFLTVLPQHMSMMGLVLLSCFPHTPSPSNPTLSCLFPKRLAFLGATSEAALEGNLAGSWVASCARALGGGDNVLLIDWASWAEFRNSQKGVMEKWGWGMSWEGWRGRDDRGRFPVHQGWFIQPQIMSVWFTRLKVVGNVLIIWLDWGGVNMLLMLFYIFHFKDVYRSHQMWSNWSWLFTWE